MQGSKLYVPFPEIGNGKVAVEYYNHYKQIINCANGMYPMHSHTHFELVLILSGTVRHTYKDITTKLIPGDIFVIPPHLPHGYQFGDELEIYNIQFYKENFISQRFLNELGGFDFISEASDFSPFMTSRFCDSKLMKNDVFSITTEQGVLHLNAMQRQYVHQIILAMQKEQENRFICSRHALQSYLEILIIEIYRIVQTQIDDFVDVFSKKRSVVLEILDYISENLDVQIDFNQIAKQYNMSPSYFRTIFKTYVGTSPIKYLNRTRVLRALEYIRLTDLPIIDIAAQVGVYDASYFTRLFKQYLGHPPKYFRNLDEQND
ncbi:MAG: AraC family transcriptional regulator [Christensenellales bacterium]